MTKALVIRSRTFGAWMRANYTNQQMKDMVEHGASSGFPKITYYAETTQLYDKFSEEIWDAIREDAADQGMRAMTFVASLQGDAEDDATLKNLLVWYYAERTAAGYQADAA